MRIQKSPQVLIMYIDMIVIIQVHLTGGGGGGVK
jgi:hypothetical protein